MARIKVDEEEVWERHQRELSEAGLVGPMLRPENSHINKMLQGLAKKVVKHEASLELLTGIERKKQAIRALKFAEKLERGADWIEHNAGTDDSMRKTDRMAHIDELFASTGSGGAVGSIIMGEPAAAVLFALMGTGAILPRQIKETAEYMKYFAPNGGKLTWLEKDKFADVLHSYAKALRKAAEA